VFGGVAPIPLVPIPTNDLWTGALAVRNGTRAAERPAEDLSSPLPRRVVLARGARQYGKSTWLEAAMRDASDGSTPRARPNLNDVQLD
jgi:hypothetical protein